MIETEHRFALVLQRRDGTFLGQAPLEPSWDRAIEWCLFQLARLGNLPSEQGKLKLVAKPVLDPLAGPPFACGFSVSCRAENEFLGEFKFPIRYFDADASAASAGLVRAGLLQPGEIFYYRLVSFGGQSKRFRCNGNSLRRADEEITPFSLSGRVVDAEKLSPTVVNGGDPCDFPVLVPDRVLSEIKRLSVSAGAAEVGGVLFGFLSRFVLANSQADVGVEVTGHVPAEFVEAGLDKLTFTPATWARVNTALALRRAGEQIVGWWHSHPVKFWRSCCGRDQCNKEGRETCSLREGFFSIQDVFVHEAVFSRPYQVALVVTVHESECKVAMFGWRSGVISNRGFWVVPG